MGEAIVQVEHCSILDLFKVEQMNCVNRPRCMIVDSFVNNARFYYLLFTELQCRYHKKFYEEWVQEKTGIQFVKQYGCAKDFDKIVKELLDSGSPLILVTDLYYEEDQPFYRRNGIHHNHYTLVKGYSTKEHCYKIIDEEFYEGKEVDTEQGLIYTEHTIMGRKLFSLACNCGLIECERKNTCFCNPSNCIFTYYIPKQTQELKLSMSMILQDYEQHLHYMKGILNDYMQVIARDFASYQEHLSYYQGQPFIPYAKEIRMYMLHFNALNTQEIVIESILTSLEQREGLKEAWQPVDKYGQRIKSYLMKSLVTQNGAYCRRILEKEYLIKLQEAEQVFYDVVLEFIEERLSNQ